MSDTPVEINMLASTLKQHLDECGALNKITADSLTGMSATLEILTDKFATIDKLVAWGRRGIAAMVLAVLSAATGVMVQNWMLHEQTKVTTQQTAAQVSNTASAAVAQATDQQTVIIQKLDALAKHK